jgi:hypothetical protein
MSSPLAQPYISERVRLERLIERDGKEASKRWARWAATLYRQCVTDSTHYASQAERRALFDESISQLERFAKTGVVS